MCVCTHMFAGVPVAETGKRCYNTAGTEGSAVALGRVFGSLVCRLLQKGLCGWCFYWKLVFSSTAVLTLTRQKQETNI